MPLAVNPDSGAVAGAEIEIPMDVPPGRFPVVAPAAEAVRTAAAKAASSCALFLILPPL